MFRTCFALALVLTVLVPVAVPGKTGDDEKEILRYRALLLTSKNYKVRIAALGKLEISGLQTPGVFEDVLKILKRHKDEQLPDAAELAEVRVSAVQWFASFKEGAKKAIPALKEAL